MRKKLWKKLVLNAETLRVLSDSQVRGVAGLGVQQVPDGSNTEEDTCYWGCSFASCPAGGCEAA